MHTKEEVFYEKGLRFECTRCSSCCRIESGYVFLSQDDLTALCSELKMLPDEFKQVYCRLVEKPGGLFCLSLKETSAYDCIFWKAGCGCTVYNARPFKCRSFPFWASIMQSTDSWKEASEQCPGCNGENAKLHSKQQIEAWLHQEKARNLLKIS
ncbi:MAG: YkgJ family cysteine cluster protein [Termitinemataceae bacterium]|nr:MAG: YkgJ family cysteine cluster protein [Termitinemataceae bacterium]